MLEDLAIDVICLIVSFLTLKDSVNMLLLNRTLYLFLQHNEFVKASLFKSRFPNFRPQCYKSEIFTFKPNVIYQILAQSDFQIKGEMYSIHEP
jgi:hypothetical protein